MDLMSSIFKNEQNSTDSQIISEEVIFENIVQNLNKWTIPKVNSTKVYNKGMFDFKQT